MVLGSFVVTIYLPFAPKWDCSSQPARGECAGELSRASGSSGRLLCGAREFQSSKWIILKPRAAAVPPLARPAPLSACCSRAVSAPRPAVGIRLARLLRQPPPLRVTCVPPSPALMHVVSLLGVPHARATSGSRRTRRGTSGSSSCRLPPSVSAHPPTGAESRCRCTPRAGGWVTTLSSSRALRRTC